MSVPVAVLALVAGFAALLAGAAWLVRGAAALALRLNISPLVIGLTVVAFGTSAPELLVSLVAVLSDRADVAVGNVIGSNIANVLLVLGLAALVRPLPRPAGALKLDLPLGIAMALAVAALGWNGRLGRLDAGLLLAMFVYFLVTTFVRRRAAETEVVEAPGPLAINIGLAMAGITVLVAGAELLVRGAVVVAVAAGVSEATIGLTIVAVGTSLPELATSVVAARRGETEISAGNILGSNVFNLGWVLAVAYLVRPGELDPVLARQDAPAAALASILLGVLLLRGPLGRRAGAVLLACYAGYVVLLAVRG
jgi:cation:H+ antiporter